MSEFKYEVQTDATKKWYGNAVTFASFEEAKEAGISKAYAWIMVDAVRVVEFEGETNLKEEVVWPGR